MDWEEESLQRGVNGREQQRQARSHNGVLADWSLKEIGSLRSIGRD